MKFCKYTYVLSFHFNFSVNKKKFSTSRFYLSVLLFYFSSPYFYPSTTRGLFAYISKLLSEIKISEFFYFILLFIKAEEEDCNKCYTEHLDHRYLRINLQALKDLTNARNLEKVFFILNGNNQEHKHAASFLAANLGKKYP